MYKINAKGESAEILIYEDIGESWIGGISAKSFAEDMKKVGRVKNLDIRINSYGGSVFDGVAIYNTLLKNSAAKTVYIDGIAASIASIIAMSGDQIKIAENGFMMIHDPWTIALGSADDLRHEAELMDKIRDELLNTYMKKASVPRETLSQMMADETWLNASESIDIGLATEMVEEKAIAACANKDMLSRYRKIPDALKANTEVVKVRSDDTDIIAARMAQTLRKFKL